MNVINNNVITEDDIDEIEDLDQTNPDPNPNPSPNPTSDNQDLSSDMDKDRNLTQNILETSTFLIIKFKTFNITKTIPKDKIETPANERYVKGNKKIVESGELDAIKAYDNETRLEIKEMTLESFHPAIYIVPEESIVKVDNYLKARKEGRRSLIMVFIAAYPDLLSNASRAKNEGGLGELFDESDYVGVDELEEQFDMDWMLVSFNVAESLKRIDQSMYDEAKAKAEVRATNLLNKLRVQIKVQFLELLDDMITKLKGTYDGKQKRLGDKFINNIYDFVEEYESKQSVLKDQEMNNIIENFKTNLSSTNNILQAKNLERKLSNKPEISLAELIKSDESTKILIEEIFTSAKGLIEENMKSEQTSLLLTDEII